MREWLRERGRVYCPAAAFSARFLERAAKASRASRARFPLEAAFLVLHSQERQRHLPQRPRCFCSGSLRSKERVHSFR